MRNRYAPGKEPTTIAEWLLRKLRYYAILCLYIVVAMVVMYYFVLVTDSRETHSRNWQKSKPAMAPTAAPMRLLSSKPTAAAPITITIVREIRCARLELGLPTFA